VNWWDRFIGWWNVWKLFLAAIIGALVFESARAVWGNRRPVGDFFEEFIARLTSLGLPVLIFGIAIYSGSMVYERTDSQALGWISGLAIFIVVGSAAYLAISQIPGVNWRFERLRESDY